MSDKTSIKQMLASIIQESVPPPGIEEGIITKREPLSITLVNDKKMILSEDDLILPARLAEEGELKTGDKVNLLVCNNGKIYYVLDKS